MSEYVINLDHVQFIKLYEKKVFISLACGRILSFPNEKYPEKQFTQLSEFMKTKKNYLEISCD